MTSPIKTQDVIFAILSVDAEARRRGEMYPQTADEQRVDRKAVTRVVEMLTWYERHGGCAHLDKWPRVEDIKDQLQAAATDVIQDYKASGDTDLDTLVKRAIHDLCWKFGVWIEP